MNKILQIGCGLFLLLCISPALCVGGEKWDFVIAPFALLPNITGDGSVGALEDAGVDIDTGDILESLDLGAMIQFEAVHESGYGAIVAYNFMDLGGEATGPWGTTSVEADIYQGIFEGFATYRLKMERGSLDFYGGIRWWDMDIDVYVSEVQKVNNGEDWVDPVIGLRWMPQVADNWRLILKGDMGGFGVASDFTWNLQGGVAWDATEYLSLVFQYRALSVDYSSGTVGAPDRFAYDTITHGPLFGLAFRL